MQFHFYFQGTLFSGSSGQIRRILQRNIVALIFFIEEKVIDTSTRTRLIVSAG